MKTVTRVVITVILSAVAVGFVIYDYSYFTVSRVSTLIGLFSLIFAAIGVNVTGLWTSHRERVKRESTLNRIKRQFASCFSPCGVSYGVVKNIRIAESTQEDAIIRELLIRIYPKENGDFINSMILAYYCYNYEKNSIKNPSDLEQIERYSRVIGIDKGGVESALFERIFKKLVSKDISDSRKGFEKWFRSKFLKQFSTDYLKEELHQSRNLTYTLRKIIKEGVLSSWNVKEETLIRIEKELKMKFNFSGTYLVIGQNFTEEFTEYLNTLPKLSGWTPTVKNIEIREGGRFSAHIVKPSDISNASEFKKMIEKKYQTIGDAAIWIVPVEFLNSQIYTVPPDGLFSNKNISKGYEQLSWFKGFSELYDEKVIWNAITRSKITVSELLSLIPFNVFCPGITQSETDMIIKNYKLIRESLDIRDLTDLAEVDISEITEVLLQFDNPDYSEEELLRLGFSLPIKQEEIHNRYVTLSEMIVKNSAEYKKTIEGYI